MKSLERRLRELEAQKSTAAPSVNAVKVLNEQERAEIIAKYGSMTHWALCRLNGVDHAGNRLPSPPTPPEPDDGLTPFERYMAMIRSPGAK